MQIFSALRTNGSILTIAFVNARYGQNHISQCDNAHILNAEDYDCTLVLNHSVPSHTTALAA